MPSGRFVGNDRERGRGNVIFQRMLRLCIAFLFISALTGTGVVSATTTTMAPATTEATTITTDNGDFIYIPTNAATRGPMQVLVTVHGMGGDGKSFCQNLINRAEQNGWIVVSPTFAYQDYHDPNLVLQDDSTMLPRLKRLIDGLPARTGLPIRDKVLLYGFSRGAQVVHRFAEFYPNRTLGVALFSAGSYTLPTTAQTFPFGVADIQKYADTPFNADAFRQVPFFLGVGGADGNAADAPRAWDAEGTTRIARAQNFENALTGFGLTSSLTVFPNIGHDVTNDMRAQAMSFLEGQALAASIAEQNRAVTQAFLNAA